MGGGGRGSSELPESKKDGKDQETIHDQVPHLNPSGFTTERETISKLIQNN